MANDVLPANPSGASLAGDDKLLFAVESTLDEFLATAVAELVRLDPAVAPLAAAARDAVLGGGKRLRPRFAYWGWRGVVGDAAPAAPVLPALAALELLHAFALVHDDVMDESATRRGRPTAHRALTGQHAAAGLRGDPQRYGHSVAILVGDLCLIWADQLMARSGLPAERLAAARHSYERMRVEAVAGQFLDLLGEASDTWPVERAMRTVRLKTASYTVVRPLHYGAALGDGGFGDPEAAGLDRASASRLGSGRRAALHDAYTRYGNAVGEAFQLRDDLLGIYGETAVTGKPVGEDLALGKPTVLLQLARSLATEAEGVELEKLLGQPDELPRLAALVRRTGAVAELGRMIDQRVATGLTALAAAPIAATARDALTDLALAAAWRTS